MIKREKIDELLNLSIDERRQILRLLQESLLSKDEGQIPFHSTNEGEASLAAEWLLSMAGRYTGGPGNTAARADEILRAEVDKRRGLTTN